MANYILGNGQNNVLTGMAGKDTLNGGYGADTLYGGVGDDTYIVDNVNDVVYENRAEGVDTILTSLVTYRLGDYSSAGSFVENLTYTGSSDFTGVGNLYANLMKSGAGSDNLSGGQGNDTLFGGVGDDTLTGGDDADQLNGEAGNDILDGGAGNDTLDGGLDDDSMVGGQGDDTYYVDRIGDSVVELGGEGTDTVISTLSDYILTNNVENLTLAGTAANGSGNGFANVITGNDLANKLFGFGGNDTLDGGAGADTLDGGDGNDTLTGGTGNDTLYGDDGNDTLNGGAGNDALYGGSGDDVYIFNRGDGIDTITDDYRTTVQLDGGQDKLLLGVGIARTDLWFSISGADLIIGVKDPANSSLAFANLTDKITLKNWFNTYNRIETIQFADNTTLTAREIVEQLATTGIDSFTWVDTAVNLSLDLGNDNVTTGAFNDSLDGGGGNDTLNSGAGDDTLSGGAGNDTLYGGLGNDVYIFNRGDGFDTIYDDYGSSPQQSAGADILKFGAGITKSQLSFSLSGADLIISVSNPASPGSLTDKITLKNWTDPLKRVETLFFTEDNSSLDARGIAELLVTSGNDTRTWTDTAINWSGGAGADKLTTGAFNDTLEGGAGNDTLDGGAGYDIARYTGASTEYTIKVSGNSYVITDKTSNRDGADTVTNIEALQFSDGLFNISAVTPLILVANTTPIISSPSTLTVVEGVSTSTAVYTVTGFDPDPGTTLTYSIVTGGDSAAFSIDPVSGAVKFLSIPDYEIAADSNKDNVYKITVQASDGSRTGTQGVDITIANTPERAPVINSSASASVDENVATTTAVYKVIGVDPETASLTYSLSGGADKGLFSINATTGDVTFLATPDYENPLDANQNRIYEIEVAASNGALVTKKAVTLTLNNVDDAPTILSATSASVAENIAVETTVYKASGVDPEGKSLTYSLSGGADKALFTIDPGTGAVRFNTKPDYETRGDADNNNIYQIEVQASDGNQVTRQTVAITLTNVSEAPSLTSPNRVIVNANTVDANTVVYQLTGGDPDVGTTLNYSIIGGFDLDLFNIDTRTGAVRFKNAPDYNNPADHGANNVYDITVQIGDGYLGAKQAVSIVVTDGEREPPAITSGKTVNVDENFAPTDVLFTVSATDGDPNTVLTYSIAGGPDKSMFNIDSSKGEVFFATSPDFEHPSDRGENNVYEITVQVSDGRMLTQQNVTITVADMVENGIIITSGMSARVNENVETTAAVYTVTATDTTAGMRLTYSLSGGADKNLFNIDANTGAVTFKTKPDYEAKGDNGGDHVYDIVVQASNNSIASTKAVAITLIDLNDNAPVIKSSTATSVAENVGTSTAVYRVVATDADAGATLTYSLSGGADNALFNINATTGAVTFKARPDYEAKADNGGDHVYDIVVQAYDGKNSTTQAVAITLTNVSEPHLTGKDFNSDGKGDILFQNGINGACYVWEMDGFKALAGGSDFVGTAVGTAWKIKGTGDFNGDGKSDILFQNAIDGAVYVWEMDGLRRIAGDLVGPAVGTSWQIKGTGDFNGDGKSDILFQSTVNGACYVWEMDGLKLVPSGSDFVGPAVGTAWQVKGTGDFNGDGKSDILFQNAINGAVYVWEMDGLRSIAGDFVGPAVGTSWQIKATGDFNGDRKSDILFQSTINGACYVWEMDGLKLVPGGSNFVGPAVGTAWQVKGTMDVNADGKSDILFQNVRDGAVYVWEMDGLTILAGDFVGPAVGTDWLVTL